MPSSSNSAPCGFGLLGLGRRHVHRDRHQQRLRGDAPRLERGLEPLVGRALVRGVHVHEHQPALRLGQDVDAVQLRDRVAERVASAGSAPAADPCAVRPRESASATPVPAPLSSRQSAHACAERRVEIERRGLRPAPPPCQGIENRAAGYRVRRMPARDGSRRARARACGTGNRGPARARGTAPRVSADARSRPRAPGPSRGTARRPAGGRDTARRDTRAARRSRPACRAAAGRSGRSAAGPPGCARRSACRTSRCRRRPAPSWSSLSACAMNSSPSTAATRASSRALVARRRMIGQRAARRGEPEADVEPAEREALDQPFDLAELGALGAQELAPRRHVEEQVAHLDGRARRMRLRRRAAQRAVHHGHRASRPARPRSARRSSSATPRRCSAAPRRESRACAPTRGPRCGRSCWSRGARARAPVRPAAMPVPSSRTRQSSAPPPSTSISIVRAPASRLFSTSSLTTDAGRSTTSPAAIWWIELLGEDPDGHGRRRPRAGAARIAKGGPGDRRSETCRVDGRSSARGQRSASVCACRRRPARGRQRRDLGAGRRAVVEVVLHAVADRVGEALLLVRHRAGGARRWRSR